MQWNVAVILISAVVLFEEVCAKPVENEEEKTVVPSCPSPIYCQGELLDLVQRTRVFTDSKTFVDMSQVNPVNVTLDNFRKLLNETNNNPTKDQVTEFVKQNFIDENETVSWTPTDFNSEPSFLSRIHDTNVQQFAKDLVGIWPILGRQLSPDVTSKPDQHSILEIPNGFIVPGGRFRELYYWDSYWIIKGLLISEMYDTVKGMLDNFCHIINQYGFMPNGARLYYLNRSQPPVFTLMVQLYLEYTGNVEWLKQNIVYVEKELNFWLKNRAITVRKCGKDYQLAHYGPKSNTPRPESYKEDVDTCNYYTDEKEKRRCYRSIKTGAETGWDFSTRWFFDQDGGTNTNLTGIDAQRVVPVDLNAFLCRGFKELSNFYKILGNNEKRREWMQRSNKWKHAIEKVLYNEEDGIWYDYDSQLQRPRKYFYPSNFAPLWAETYDHERKEEYGERAAAYFTREGITSYLGGIPTSLEQSNEQWDFKNAWPPLQDFVVLGLWKTGNKNATDLANLFATRWVSANMIGYNENKIMFEKYDAVEPGKFGGGGEYTVQAGFGWTNGVALSFIDLFYTNLS